MAKYTFYGGAGEIGGNKILLEDRDVRAYLDFGQSFNFGSGYFYDYLQPRSVNGLEILFEFGLIPRIPRLYARDALRFTDLPYGRPDIDAVFISHHHGDHTGHLSCIDESIPVYMGHGTRKIIEIYNSLYRGVCDIGDHESIRTFRSGDCIELKHMTFQPIHVEHSHARRLWLCHRFPGQQHRLYRRLQETRAQGGIYRGIHKPGCKGRSGGDAV